MSLSRPYSFRRRLLAHLKVLGIAIIFGLGVYGVVMAIMSAVRGLTPLFP